MAGCSIALGLISDGDMHHDFVLELIGATLKTKHDITLIGAKSSLVPKSRDVVAKRFLNDTNCTHLLFLDTDMIFPSEIIDHMVERDKGVLAANCTNRKFPVRFTADFPTTESSTGLQRTSRVGTAVMMLKREVFSKLSNPYFSMGYDHQQDGHVGEDYYFCKQLNKAGIPIWIDHDLSKAIGHIGNYTYTWRNYG